MKTHDLILFFVVAAAMTSCESADSNATYDRASDRQLYNQNLQQQQFMGQTFGRYGGPQIISSPEDFYRIPQSR
jgi:hypothetical protein